MYEVARKKVKYSEENYQTRKLLFEELKEHYQGSYIGWELNTLFNVWNWKSGLYKAWSCIGWSYNIDLIQEIMIYCMHLSDSGF